MVINQRVTQRLAEFHLKFLFRGSEQLYIFLRVFILMIFGDV